MINSWVLLWSESCLSHNKKPFNNIKGRRASVWHGVRDASGDINLLSPSFSPSFLMHTVGREAGDGLSTSVLATHVENQTGSQTAAFCLAVTGIWGVKMQDISAFSNKSIFKRNVQKKHKTKRYRYNEVFYSSARHLKVPKPCVLI